ncbi:hypothetical protein GOV05_01790 [Candidatus Woesearchaeota archaeon]|nr:hypothetical protein [Candidatus Woesearchaeota archaeon]
MAAKKASKPKVAAKPAKLGSADKQLHGKIIMSGIFIGVGIGLFTGEAASLGMLGLGLGVLTSAGVTLYKNR